MSTTNNYDYTDSILHILKRRKFASQYLLKDSIRSLKWDDKGEEKLKACLDKMVSSGTIFVHTALNKGLPVNVYHLDPEKNRYFSTLNRNVCGDEASDCNVGNDDVHNTSSDDDDCNNSNDGDDDDDGDNQEEQDMSETVATPQQQIEKPEYIIDPEFQSLLGTKTPEQYEALKEAIRRDEEVRDSLVVWLETSILIDGHTRHQIYEELRDELGEKFCIKPPVIYWVSFEDREQAKMWALENQLDRRNLKTFQQIEIALKLKEFYAAKAKANQLAGVSLNLGKGINSNEEVAKRADVSHDTVRKVERILEKAGKKEVAEAIDALRRGDEGVSIDGVYQQFCGKKKAKKKPVPSPPAPAKESDSEPVSDPPSKKKATSEPNTRTPQETAAVVALSEQATTAPFTIKPSLPGLERDVDEMCFYFRDKIARCRQKEDRLYVLHRLQEFVKKIEAEWDKIKLPR